MAFEDDAAKPKGRRYLYLGMTLLGIVLAQSFVWQLAGLPPFPGADALGIARRTVNLVAILVGGWLLIKHFRGSERPFSARERRYWWSYLLLLPFMLPLMVYGVTIQSDLEKVRHLASEGQRHEAMKAILTQPISPWFAATIAVTLLIGTVWSLWVYFRNADELEVRANLWAGLLAWIAMSFGAPIWYFLWLGGLAPPVGVVGLLAIGLVVASGVFTKLRFF